MKRQINRSGRWLRSIASTLVLLAVPALSGAQTPAPRSVAVDMLHLNVTSLDQSIALYRDVLGMEFIEPPAGPRSAGFFVPDPGAMMNIARMRVPGGSFELEVIEFSGTPLRPVEPRIQDPGEIMLAMEVRDLDAKLAGAKKLGLRVLSRNGEPVTIDGRRTVALRDPSGFVVELTEGSASGSIGNVAIYLTVADLAQTVRFYNQTFGFTMPAPPAPSATPEAIKALLGDTSLATIRRARGVFPGTKFELNFQEFPQAGRKPARHRIQDPGGPVFVITVNDLPGIVAQMRATGGIIGLGEQSEALAPEAFMAWTRDPNGALLLVRPPQPPRGGGDGRGGRGAAPGRGQQ